MLQSKLDVLTTTALQSDTIYGELGSLKKKERTNSILYGPALLLLLAACGGGGGGGGTVSVSSPEPADTDDTPTEDIRVKVGAGPADADGVHRATVNSTKIDIDAEALQPEGLSAIYKSGDDGTDITLEFVDQQNQLSHVFTISNVDNGDLDITVDNKALFIKFGEDNDPDQADDLSGANNYVSFIDGGEGDDALSGGNNKHNLFGFSGNNFGNDTIVNPSPKSEGYINSGDIISFINYVLRRPSDEVELRAGLTEEELVRPTFPVDSDNLLLTTTNGSSVTVNNGAYLDIGIRSSHGNVENFIYALSSPEATRVLIGTDLPDIIFGRGDADKIKGLAGNDEIVGGAGADTIDAGYGDDYIEGGAGADTIDGSFGIDTASYINSKQAVQVDLSNNIDNAAVANVNGIIARLNAAVEDENLTGFLEDAAEIKSVLDEMKEELDAVVIPDSQNTLISDVITASNGLTALNQDSTIVEILDAFETAKTAITEANSAIIVERGGDAEGDVLRNIQNLIGSKFGDTLTGNGGNDVFVAHIADGDMDTITDFTDGDKVRIDVDDSSAITDLASLYTTLSITATNNTDQTGNGVNDTVLRFERGPAGTQGDYLIVFEGFTDALDINDFDII